jgi:KDO2-lipid IV(A) lauroyltransferase
VRRFIKYSIKIQHRLVNTSKRFPISPEIKTSDLSIYGLPSDPIPKGKSSFSLEFLYGIEVPVHTSPEMLAKYLNVI